MELINQGTIETTALVLEYSQLWSALREVLHSGLFLLMMLVMFIDVIIGKFKAVKTGELSSRIGVNGFIKHMAILLITIAVAVVCVIGNVRWISYGIEFFYIFEYTTSIMENLELIGVPLPLFIKNMFNTMKVNVKSKYNQGLTREEQLMKQREEYEKYRNVGDDE